MDCKLCGKVIKNYSPEFNHLKLEADCEVDICQECVEKFSKWQQEILAKMFPTKTMKKFISQKR